MEQFTAQFSWMISPSVMLAPYGLLTGVCYRSATDHVTRKWTEEWCQYCPVECGGSNSPQTATGAGKEKRSPGGGLADLEAASETEDLVQVIVSNVPMRYPTYYIWSVMRTVQSTRVPSINWWFLKDYIVSTVSVAPPTPHSHALPSVPPMGKLTDNFSNNNSKPHNVCVCVIYFILFHLLFV